MMLILNVICIHRKFLILKQMVCENGISEIQKYDNLEVMQQTDKGE